jgi:hypothetical protein
MNKKRKENRRAEPEPVQQNAPAPSPNAASLEQAESMPRTYLPESILALVLCLTPVALPAIYYGLAVRQWSHDDRPKAEAASEQARIWFIFAICFGVTANIAILGAYLISQKT